jgi:hypothetical protein
MDNSLLGVFVYCAVSALNQFGEGFHGGWRKTAVDEMDFRGLAAADHAKEFGFAIGSCEIAESDAWRFWTPAGRKFRTHDQHSPVYDIESLKDSHGWRRNIVRVGPNRNTLVQENVGAPTYKQGVCEDYDLTVFLGEG